MAWVGPRTGPGGTRSVYLRCFLDDEAESEANLATASHQLKQEEMEFWVSLLLFLPGYTGNLVRGPLYLKTRNRPASHTFVYT